MTPANSSLGPFGLITLWTLWSMWAGMALCDVAGVFVSYWNLTLHCNALFSSPWFATIQRHCVGLVCLATAHISLILEPNRHTYGMMPSTLLLGAYIGSNVRTTSHTMAQIACKGTFHFLLIDIRREVLGTVVTISTDLAAPQCQIDHERVEVLSRRVVS